MPVTFVLWNLRGKSLSDEIAAIVAEHGISVLVLLEDPLHPAARVCGLSHEPDAWRHVATVDAEQHKVHVYSRLAEDVLSPGTGDWRCPTYTLRLPGQDEMLLVAAHLPDRHNHGDSVQGHCRDLARLVREAERRIGHKRTVVIGDLNLAPYDEALVSAEGSHAVMASELALRRTRVVQHETYDYFYNPMWSHYGDRSPGPPGTWYWNHSSLVCQFWHILDQVLVRPDLIEAGLVERDCTTILDRAGATSLLREDHTPDSDNASDHLPLVFRLNCDYDANAR